jgi:elongation factor Ts
MSIKVSAADVKKLRDLTDAPLLECRSALEEAENDFQKARQILREKGRTAAAKRAANETSAGAVAIAVSEDQKKASGVVLQSETDFVARNEEFLKLADEMANIFLQESSFADPLAVMHQGKSIGSMIEETIAKIRENIKLKSATNVQSECCVGYYVHHDKTKGAIVKLQGNISGLAELGRLVAVQIVAHPPSYLNKEDVPQEIIQKELEIEKERAIKEGKTPEVAENIAKGRINKEFYQRAVLLEQPFYRDASKSVGQMLQEEAKARGGDVKVLEFEYLTVGDSQGE